MESMRPRVYSVRGPEIPKKYGGNAFSPPPSKCEIPEKKGISSLFQNLQGDDLLILGLMILLLNEGGEDNYIMLIILAALLFN